MTVDVFGIFEVQKVSQTGENDLLERAGEEPVLAFEAVWANASVSASMKVEGGDGYGTLGPLGIEESLEGWTYGACHSPVVVEWSRHALS